MLDHMIVLDLHKKRHQELMREAEKDRQAQASKRTSKRQKALNRLSLLRPRT